MAEGEFARKYSCVARIGSSSRARGADFRFYRGTGLFHFFLIMQFDISEGIDYLSGMYIPARPDFNAFVRSMPQQILVSSISQQ